MTTTDLARLTFRIRFLRLESGPSGRAATRGRLATEEGAL
jgi:hypothetical protein